MRLLVVDDEKDVKLLFEQKFRREIRSGEVELVYAYSGEDALQTLLASDAADIIIILSDINMPGMTGLELLREIKEKMPRKGVMMITAYGDDHTKSNALSGGADDFVTKPINFEDLKTRIADLRARIQKEA